MPLPTVDTASEHYANSLDKVLSELEIKLTSVIGNAKTARDSFDAATILNSRGEMLQALRDAGYHDLAQSHIDKYPDIVKAVRADFDKRGLPAFKFSAPNVETFQQIAVADLSRFNVIGAKAVDDLRYELYRHAISSRPFEDMVRTIKAATTGVAKNGSPLKNYSYTHANSAILNFSGEVIREAGEEIGADKWEVVGPLDDVTRQECRDALADPVRSKEKWGSYWGGTPGGWNCRHQLYPYINDD